MRDGRGSKWTNALLRDGYDKHDDAMPHDKYVKWQRSCLSEMMRVLRSDGAIFYNHKWRVQKGLIQNRQDIVNGFPVRQIIIWQRSGGINFNPGYFLPTYEVIAKPDFKLARGANTLGDVWRIPQENKKSAPCAISGISSTPLHKKRNRWQSPRSLHWIRLHSHRSYNGWDLKFPQNIVS